MTSIKHTPLLAGIAAALLVGSAAAAYLLGDASQSDSVIELPAATYAAASSSVALPARLRIPALHIDARMQHVGRTAAGLMATPSNFTDVGWYTGGTRPGGEGSAVITGHVDNALGLDGVFKHLGEITVGKDVYIETEDGETLHFRVTHIEVYPYQRVPLDELFTKGDGAYLNLITCSGTWLPIQRTYDHRLVVYAELVS